MKREKEEYKNSIRALEAEFEKNRWIIGESYAMSNNPYKVGDIIEDNYHIIEIQRVEVVSIRPNYLYYGIELKKDLTPKIRQSNTHMWQSFAKIKVKKIEYEKDNV